MHLIAEIRRRHFVSGESISFIARSLNLSRPTVRKHLKTELDLFINELANLSPNWDYLSHY